MKVDEHIHLVGSGDNGFSISDRCDCHIWLLDGGSDAALIDSGAGRNISRVLDLIDQAGVDRDRVSTIFITHAHADHAGGARGLAEALGSRVVASRPVAEILRAGDNEAASVPVGKASGAYPPDYSISPTPVDVTSDGERVQIGSLTVEAVDTPGHASGHMCYLVRSDGRRDLFTGDMMLTRGRLIIQNTWDCDSVAYLRSVRRLRELSIDGFFPGHFSFAAQRGKRHIEMANQAMDAGGFPPTL